MTRDAVTAEDLRGLFAVPPLPRKSDARRTLDLDEAERVAKHIAAGRGHALPLRRQRLSLPRHARRVRIAARLAGRLPARTRWAIPSLGPSFGRALDQAPAPATAFLPLRDDASLRRPPRRPRHGGGPARGGRGRRAAPRRLPEVRRRLRLGQGARPRRGGPPRERRRVRGRQVRGRARPIPTKDSYLDGLLRRVDRRRVVSGIGERPAVVHLRDRRPRRASPPARAASPRGRARRFSRLLRRATGAKAERLWGYFQPLEDLRDAWGPARVLHQATELAGIANRAHPARSSRLSMRGSWRASPRWRGLFGRGTREPAPQVADRPAQPPLVRPGRPALLRAPLARQADRASRPRTVQGKPVIAILNTWSDANPCHAHFRLARGGGEAGGLAGGRLPPGDAGPVARARRS